MSKYLLVALLTLVAAFGYICFSSWTDKSVKFTQIKQSQPPLTEDQVTALLGLPIHIDQSESTGVKGEVYYYPWHTSQMEVIFVNGHVFNVVESSPSTAGSASEKKS